MIKFPKIPQLKQMVREVSDRARYYIDDDGLAAVHPIVKLPTIEFKGTVKLHGTNASIVLDNDKGFRCQSRSNVITPEKDNAGFAEWGHNNDDTLVNLLLDVADTAGIDLDRYSIVLYGEWCGGNIQKGIAINGLPKMFVLFAGRAVRIGDVQHIDATWLDMDGAQGDDAIGLYNINDFDSYSMVIDLNHPDAVINQLAEITSAVEDCCPVGRWFGRTKSKVTAQQNTTGEGVVWKAIHEGKLLAFKVKGEKHTTTRVKTLHPITAEMTAKMELVQEFVSLYACTPSRLEQIFNEVMDTVNGGAPDIKKTGVFLKTLVNDVLVEEATQMIEMGLEKKDVARATSISAKAWMFLQL